MFARVRVAHAAKLKVPKEVKQHLRFLDLGVSTLADGGKMKERYRELAKRYHPDVNRGDDGRMKELNRAYREVLVFADENAEAIRTRAGAAGAADDKGRRRPRFGEDVEGKAEELSLVSKLARWMRRSEDAADAARAKTAANPAAEYRAYAEQAREEAGQFGTVLGTEEQELAWAERFRAEREEQLDGRKNAEKERKREERVRESPFDAASEGSVRRRLERLSLVSEPHLYCGGLRGTSVRPELDAARAAFLGIAKPAAENPHLALRAARKKKFFYEHEAPWAFELERRDAAMRKHKHIGRWIEKINKNLLASDGGSLEMNALSKALEKTHNGSMEALTAGSAQGSGGGAPWQKPAVDVNGLGFRAPKSLRKSGNLVTLKQTDPATGKPTMIQMASGAFLKKGIAAP